MNKFSNRVLIPIQKPPKTYINALLEVGLTPVCNFAPKDASSYSGLLLTGGGDISPRFYGSNIPARNVNFFRDFAEFKILDFFVKNRLPVLGVCRGCQIINVYFGGTLKNVDGHNCKDKDLFHPVEPVELGFLKGVCEVNSAHCQAVDILCKNAENICYSHDKTVEGFTVNGNILAVQFHPERMDGVILKKVYGAFYDLIKSRR